MLLLGLGMLPFKQLALDQKGQTQARLYQQLALPMVCILSLIFHHSSFSLQEAEH